MKPCKYAKFFPSAAAVIAGVILLLGVVLSFRCLLAIVGIGLIAWGILVCRN